MGNLGVVWVRGCENPKEHQKKHVTVEIVLMVHQNSLQHEYIYCRTHDKTISLFHSCFG